MPSMVVIIVSRAYLIAVHCIAVGATWIALVHRHDLRALGGCKSTISGVVFMDAEFINDTANVLIGANATTQEQSTSCTSPMNGNDGPLAISSSTLVILIAIHPTFTLVSVS